MSETVKVRQERGDEVSTYPGDIGPKDIPTLDRLRAIEWQRKEYGGGPGAATPYVIYECPNCEADQADGHKPGCIIAECITEHEKRAGQAANARKVKP